MRGAAGGLQQDALDAAGGEAKAAVGRLSVDQVLATARLDVRALRPFAAPLLAHHEEQADPRLAPVPQDLRGRYLRGQDALRIARTAPIDSPLLDPAREERRNAIEVRRVHHDRRLGARGGQYVEARIVHLLFDYREAEFPEVVGQEECGRAFAASRRIDVHQRTGKPDEIDAALHYLLHASGSVGRWSAWVDMAYSAYAGLRSCSSFSTRRIF